jgi:serine/threonine protein kinase
VAKVRLIRFAITRALGGKQMVVISQPRGATRRDSRFDGFELEELVDRGRISVIYKARDLRLGRQVALRIIGPELAGDPVTRARLNRAASALASVDHPNVVPIYGTGEADGKLYIATRWIDGTDLSSLVREEGPINATRAVRIVNQVASALQAAHAVGIMHRNVRPSRVLITATDHAYLTDFALARRDSDLTGLTMQEHLLDSVDYLAPEYLAGDDVDARVDIYGLGCVLYEALTGEVPYPAATPAAKMYAQRSADPPSAHARRSEVPEALDAVVTRAMAKDPSARYQSPGEFAVAAAGAVGMSGPLWATRGPVLLPVDEGRPAEAEPSSRTSGRRAENAGSIDDRWSEPKYFARPPQIRARRLAVGVGLLLFVLAPIALLLALVLHG